MGSCSEFESEILLAHDVRFLPADVHDRFADTVAEVRGMLTSFIRLLG